MRVGQLVRKLTHVAQPVDFCLLPLLNVVDLLVPELQRRGRFRKAYDGKTLKENLLED